MPGQETEPDVTRGDPYREIVRDDDGLILYLRKVNTHI